VKNGNDDLVHIAHGGGAFRAREVREVLDDERARAQRARAYQNAFWALRLVALLGYIAAQFAPIDAKLLAHASLSVGVPVAAVTLAYLNRH
jgi:hypothetical protein